MTSFVLTLIKCDCIFSNCWPCVWHVGQKIAYCSTINASINWWTATNVFLNSNNGQHFVHIYIYNCREQRGEITCWYFLHSAKDMITLCSEWRGEVLRALLGGWMRHADFRGENNQQPYTTSRIYKYVERQRGEWQRNIDKEQSERVPMREA